MTQRKKKNQAQQLSEHNWIVKSNTLNEIRNNTLTISQQRFFVIYQSKINPSDPKSRLVNFKLSEYVRLMQFKQINITRLEETAEGILQIIAKFKDSDGGFMMCQIFKQFRLYKEVDDEWYVSIDCHDDVLPYMFELQKYFFRYQLWNALRLTSSNQIRMYEILKQYEKAGAREISVNDLREFLGIAVNEYTRWDNFKARILDACQRALAENTDIKFTYEQKRKGVGGKVTALKFFIEKNLDYENPLSLDEFIESQGMVDYEEEPTPFQLENQKLEFLTEACDGEFDEDQMQVLKNIVVDLIPLDEIKQYDYIKRKYDEMCMRKPKRSRFGYLKKLLEADKKEEL